MMLKNKLKAFFISVIAISFSGHASTSGFDGYWNNDLEDQPDKEYDGDDESRFAPSGSVLHNAWDFTLKQNGNNLFGYWDQETGYRHYGGCLKGRVVGNKAYIKFCHADGSAGTKSDLSNICPSYETQETRLVLSGARLYMQSKKQDGGSLANQWYTGSTFRRDLSKVMHLGQEPTPSGCEG